MNEIPETMTALHLVGNGGPEMLVLRHDVAVPVPADDEVLVRVRACGMNNTDVNTRVGWYSKSVTAATGSSGFDVEVDGDATWGGSGLAFPRIQGADPCGEVVAVGSEANPALLGSRVLADGWIRDPGRPDDRSLAGYLGWRGTAGTPSTASSRSATCTQLTSTCLMPSWHRFPARGLPPSTC